MKSIFHDFQKRNRVMHLTVAALIACMALADASLYMNYAEGISGEDTVITEKHELPFAMADGNFGGENSKGEQPNYGDISTDAPGISINIYEIVPEYGNAYFGYLIGGCEPIYPPVNAFDDEAIERSKAKALEYMDALCNFNPGGNNDSYNFDLKIDNEGVRHFGFYKDREVEGYYERVSNNTGLYKLVRAQGNSTQITNVEMKSKAKGEGGSDYNYEWHYGAPDGKNVITDASKVNNNGMNVGDVIYFTNYKKNVYGNNESFLTLFYSEGKANVGDSDNVKVLNAEIDGTTRYVDGYNGVYSIQNNNKDRHISDEFVNNKAVVDAWKQINNINVFVRTPADLSDDDINNADLLVFTPGGDNAKNVVDMYNRMNGTSHSAVGYSGGSDLSFEQVINIYDHVVNKQDLAIAMCKANFGTLKSNDLNIGKLQWMLYSIKGNGDNHWGSGREYFNEIIESLNPTDAFNRVRLTSDKVTHRSNDDQSWDSAESWGRWWTITDYQNDFYNRFLKDVTHNTNVTGLDNDPQKGQYKNMMIFENDTQLTMSNQSAGLFKDILKSHVEAKHSKTTKQAFYLSMDILNGDSRTGEEVTGAKNKVLYVNEYELPPTSPEPSRTYTESIPIHIRIFSSHDLEKVEVYKNATIDPTTKMAVGGTNILNLDTSDLLDAYLVASPDSEKKTVLNDVGSPVEIDVKKYEDAELDADNKLVVKINISSSDLKNPAGKYSSNTPIVVVVKNNKGKYASDSINIVKRDFFMLN